MTTTIRRGIATHPTTTALFVIMAETAREITQIAINNPVLIDITIELL